MQRILSQSLSGDRDARSSHNHLSCCFTISLQYFSVSLAFSFKFASRYPSNYLLSCRGVECRSGEERACVNGAKQSFRSEQHPRAKFYSVVRHWYDQTVNSILTQHCTWTKFMRQAKYVSQRHLRDRRRRSIVLRSNSADELGGAQDGSQDRNELTCELKTPWRLQEIMCMYRYTCVTLCPFTRLARNLVRSHDPRSLQALLKKTIIVLRIIRAPVLAHYWRQLVLIQTESES